MKRKKIKWTTTDSRAAIKQGWDLFDSGERFEICRIDCPEDGSGPVFNDDDAAVAFVINEALKGNKRAIKALIHTWIMDPVTSSKVMSNALERFLPCGWDNEFHGVFSAVDWDEVRATKVLAKERSERIRDDESIFS